MSRLSIVRAVPFQNSKAPDLDRSAAQHGWVDAVLATLPALLTTDEATDVLRTTRRNLYRWISAGRLHAVKAGTGGRVLVPRTAIEAYLRALDPA